MKVHREWRISGDTAWLRGIWPQVKQSLAYCIETWDPDHRGALVEPHSQHLRHRVSTGLKRHAHDTLPRGVARGGGDGALPPSVRKPRRRNTGALYEKGRKRGMEKKPWNGEYFIQKIE